MSQGTHGEPPELPEKIGPYRLGDRLGAGGMGQVFRAYDERLQRWVAIKQLLPRNLGETDARERFRREARAVASLNHPAIVQIYDVLETELGDWIVTELVEGEDLRRLIPDHGLELAYALLLARQIAEGLAEAHAKGIVHRDLKTDNVMVTPAGHAKILDFGLAKSLSAEGEESALSKPGVVLGTSRAMSPEQAAGDALDHRSDLFSFGTLLFEMFTGQTPFGGATRSQTMARICTFRQPSLRQVRPGVPRRLSALVDDLLAKEPSRRPQDTAIVATILADLTVGGAGSPSRSAGGLHLPASRLAGSRSGSASSLSGTGLSAVTAEVSGSVALKTLLHLDLIDSTRWVKTLGDARISAIMARHDRMARDLVARHQGREVDKTDGFLLLFERPVDAVECALAYHGELAQLARETGTRVQARAGIHLGEVFLRQNTPGDVARGAKQLEVEGLARSVVARVMSLAGGGQTLMTQGVYELARRSLVGSEQYDDKLRWRAHGPYRFAGVDEDTQIYEAGVEGVAPLAAPRGTTRVRRRRRRLLPALVAAAVLLAAIVAIRSLRETGGLIQERPAVAVLGFKKLSQRPDDAWLSTALAEMVSSELAASGQMRLIPRRNVARMKRDLSLVEAEAFAGDTLRQIRRHLGADYVIVGSYVALGQDQGTRMQLMSKLQNTDPGETLAALPERGTDAELFELVSRVGAGVRQQLGLGGITEAEAKAVRASISASRDARRLYSQGLEKLRAYDPQAARRRLADAVAADPAFALAHAALSEVYAALGDHRQSAASARRALDLSQDLPREMALAIEARHHEASARWPEAIQTYKTLWGFFPDNVDHGLRLADAQRLGGESTAALATVEALHALPEPVGDDPRIDLVEADAARSLSDSRRELAAAERAVDRSRRLAARSLTAEGEWRRGRALGGLGEGDAAAVAFAAARQLFHDLGDLGGEARVLSTQAAQHAALGDSAAAEVLYRQALAIYRQIGHREGAAGASWRTGGVLP